MDPHRSGMPSEERVTKRWYIDNGRTPVCVWHDERGLARTAQVPSTRSRVLVHDTTMLVWIEASGDLVEVDEPGFRAACEEFWDWHRAPPG